MADKIETIIGIDFGDSETAIASVNAHAKAEAPQEIITTLGNTATGIIQTVVGRLHGGGIVVGSSASHAPPSQLANLHVGFKTLPRSEDQEYKTLAKEFLDAIAANLNSKGLVDFKKSRFVFGHPTRWKSIDQGQPVEIFKKLIKETAFGNAQIEVVPESRAALVQAIQSRLLSAERARSGWVLVIDVGSSTTDFTAVDLKNRTSSPIDFGDEIGARLIDRAIWRKAVAEAESREGVMNAIARNPSLEGHLELKAREAKEAYFSTSDRAVQIERTETISDGSKKYYVTFSLNRDSLSEITTRVPVVKRGERHLSWCDAFKEVLQQVQEKLTERGIKSLGAIVLTGGASRMDFVSYLCEEVFPEHAGKIVCSPKPSFDIAYGLARWGKVEVQTSSFIDEVEEFCKNRIPKLLESKYDELLKELSSKLRIYIIEKIIDGLNSWRNGRYTSINDMESGIRSSIEQGLATDGKEIIGKVTEPWIQELISDLAQEVSPIEDRYGMRRGTLGASFILDSSILDVFGGGIPGRAGGYMDGAMGALGGIVAAIAGIVSFIVAAYVYPVVAILVVKIVAVVSMTLAGGILAILATNPVGWAIMAAAGIAGAVAGKEYAMNKIKDLDLPTWVREKMIGAKVYSEVRGKGPGVEAGIYDALAQSKELRKKVEKGLSSAMSSALREKAEESRLLIN